MSSRRALSHLSDDSVAVAVEDISEGEQVEITALEGGGRIEVRAAGDIPLGHKIAIGPIGKGDEVIKYGVVIGKATREVGGGEHVHIHNLRGLRWQNN